jgi:uncharacterized membrane protein SirB2
MMSLYPLLKMLHVFAVLASGAVFLVRGVLVLGGRERLAMAAPLRYGSYTIDTVLLAAALTLSVLLAQYPFVHGWLTVKVLLLFAYIGFGVMALRRGRTRASRAGWFALALSTFAMIYLVARAHHPLGPLAGLLG